MLRRSIRRCCRDSTCFGRGALAGSDRYQSDRDRAPQRRHQRARRHAQRRHPADRNGKYPRGKRRAAGRGCRPGLCPGVAARHRNRDEPRGRWSAHSSRSSRQKKSARERGWGCRWFSASCGNPVARSAFAAACAKGPRCRSICREPWRPRPSARAGRRSARAAGEARILVVDDDPDVRWITAEGLREIGYVITEADSGRAAPGNPRAGRPLRSDGGRSGDDWVDRGGHCTAGAAYSTRPQGAVLQRICGHVVIRCGYWHRSINTETVQPGYPGRGGSCCSSPRRCGRYK